MEKSEGQNFDFLGIGTMLKFKSEINPNEQILYSNKLKKFNQFGFQKEFTFLITSQRLCYYKDDVLNKKNDITDIVGLTKCINESKGEIVIHFNSTYDSRLKTDQRDLIISILKKPFYNLMNENLPIYGVKPKSLDEFTTKQRDLKRGIRRIPLPMSRLFIEDYYHKDKPNSQQHANLVENPNVLDDYSEQVAARKTVQMLNKILQMDEEKDKQVMSGRQKSITLYARESEKEADLDDFQVKKIIGIGTFGKVYLVFHKTSAKFFAMKSIRKDIIIEKESLENIRLEKYIMMQVEHPFLLSLQYVFQRDYRIYFMMDFIRGGELYKVLTAAKFFTEDQARFYIAQIALALDYLHQSHIVYRDLKPENILVAEDGYLKLADFGLAGLVNDNMRNSFCGTPEYLAPEMIEGTGHDTSLDWWTLGVLLYEMIVGIPPFYNKNQHQMYQQIVDSALKFPKLSKHGFELTPICEDLLTKLLNKDKTKRLGKNGVNEILSHEWFKGINSKQLLNKMIEPPFKPLISSAEDLSNFDQKLTQLDIRESNILEEKQKLIEEHKSDFLNF